MSKASDKNVRPTWMRGQLGEVNIERIDVLGADIAQEEPRIIWRLPAPRPPDAKVPAQIAQTENVLSNVLPDFHAMALGIIRREVVVVDVLAVLRPVRVIHVWIAYP